RARRGPARYRRGPGAGTRAVAAVRARCALRHALQQRGAGGHNAARVRRTALRFRRRGAGHVVRPPVAGAEPGNRRRPRGAPMRTCRGRAAGRLCTATCPLDCSPLPQRDDAMPLHRFAAAVASLSIALLAACSGGDDSTPLPPGLACQGGAWTMDDGSVLSIVPVTDGLRYRLLDGRTGRLEPADAASPGDALEAREGWRETGPVVARARPAPCPANQLEFALDGGPQGTARRLALPQHDTQFDSGGLRLRGRLVLPADAAGPVPLAVLVHGSERYSGVDGYPMQYLLPAQGVAVFVYDKRGTGGSQGEYSQDFHALAGDAVAALAEARRLHPPGFSRAGFVGSSQGGWVAPLAASRSDADYVVVLYGMAEGALAEDREQVMDELRRKGHGDEVLARARE